MRLAVVCVEGGFSQIQAHVWYLHNKAILIANNDNDMLTTAVLVNVQISDTIISIYTSDCFHMNKAVNIA